jgi:flagellar biogenesis protein FliO
MIQFLVILTFLLTITILLKKFESKFNKNKKDKTYI